MAWINPIIGRAASSPEILAELEENCELTVRAVEKEITGKQFLVGSCLTMADLFVISGLARGYQFVRSLNLLVCVKVVRIMDFDLVLNRSSRRDGLLNILLCMNITCVSGLIRYSSELLVSLWFGKSLVVLILLMRVFDKKVVVIADYIYSWLSLWNRWHMRSMSLRTAFTLVYLK